MKKKTKVLVGIAVIVVAMGVLLALSLSRSQTYFMTLEELLSKPATADRQLRVSGKIVGSTVSFDQESVTLKFEITDGKRRLPISYQGVKPSSFEDGNEAIVEGKIDSAGVFHAEKLMTKCPSKYESK
jgi:cytochrome c-type biogenesis protein CcmE